MIEAAAERTIAQVVEQIRGVFGTDLISVALYGSALGEDFVPGRSDLNFAIVVERIRVGHLTQLHVYLRKWRKVRVAMPLLLDRRSLDRARDVFPMELHDLKAQHRVLYGEEVFAPLVLGRRHLRYQSEYEARTKLLRLRALYAEIGGDAKRLTALMLDSVKTFAAIMRSFIRLRDGEAGVRYLDVLDQFERHFGLAFPTMRHLLRVKLGLAAPGGKIEELFHAYLDEVERLVDLVDRVLPEQDPEPPPTGR